MGERLYVDINTENRAKELAKEAIKQALNELTEKDLVKKIAKEVAKEAIFEMANSGKDRRLQNTRLLMRNYMKLKEHIEGDGETVKIKYESIDEDNKYMKVEFMWLESIAKSKARTAEMVNYINEKLDYLEYKYELKGEKEKFKSFKMYFIEEKTNEEIQKELNCGINTPKKWNDRVLGELSILLWGIDALKIC